MAKIVVTAEVKDVVRWEEKFRTHGEMFKEHGTKSPILIGIGENNQVAIVLDVDDPSNYMETSYSPENIQAMEANGVNRDTVKVFFLDKEYSF